MDNKESKFILVVGAGWAGSVFAREMAELGHYVTIVDSRDHIGGNCYDEAKDGSFVHKYGPHIFHTDNKRVSDYVQKFGEWRPYHHRVKAFIDGKYVEIPFNFNTIRDLFPKQKAEEIESWLLSNFEYGSKVAISKIQEVAKEDGSPLGAFISEFIYNKIFKNYTAKQWGIDPDKVDKSVLARVPISLSVDDRYFQEDKYQMMPSNGYTSIFQNLLDHVNINVLVNYDCNIGGDEDDLKKCKVTHQDETGTTVDYEYDEIVYTGQIDKFFKYSHGELPYRTINFKEVNLAPGEKLPAATTNFPNDYDFTRLTDYKQLHQINQTILGNTKVYGEFSSEFVKDSGQTPYYCVNSEESKIAYEKYKAESDKYPNIHFIGRLAEFAYYDQDDIILKVLEYVEENFGSKQQTS